MFPESFRFSPDFCGSVSSSSDFTVNASEGIPFTGMVWASYTGDFNIASYQYFTWNSNREISTAGTWSIQADNYNQTLSDYSGLDKIYCTHSGYNRLEYVRLQNALEELYRGIPSFQLHLIPTNCLLWMNKMHHKVKYRAWMIGRMVMAVVIFGHQSSTEDTVHLS